MVGVMDLLALKEIKISDMQIKQIGVQIVTGLEYLHQNGYLHRDVKPSNIMIDRQGVVKLADFSITTKVRPEMTGNTTTRYYRAPELMYGEKHYSFEIDIWSLGCTLAELMLHESIFQGTTDISQLEKIFMIVGYPV
jgi:CTD kinase subunit alpha